MAVTIMKMNLRGVYFEVNIDSLQRAPYSRLSRLAKGEEKVPLDSRGCYFYDRNPALFHAMLDYYSTGRLDIPLDLSWPVVREELDFWQIDKSLLSPHCMVKYAEEDEFLDRVAEVEKGLDRHSLLVEGAWCQGLAAKTKGMWNFLENPSGSVPSLVYGVLMYVVLSLVSLLNAAVFTRAEYFDTHGILNETDHDINATKPDHAHGRSPQMRIIIYIEIVTMCLIFVELLVRFCVWPSKLRFFKDTLNWCDLLGTVLPALSMGADQMTHHAEHHARAYLTLLIHFSWAFCSLRIFRFFRMWRSYDTFKAFSLALKRTAAHLFLTFVIFTSFILTFALFTFVAEYQRKDRGQNSDSPFIHAFRSAYYTANSLSTIGFGDLIPVTLLGKLFASLMAGTAILVAVLPVPAFVTNYTLAKRQIIAARALRHAKEEQKKIVLGADLGSAEEGFQSSSKAQGV